MIISGKTNFEKPLKNIGSVEYFPMTCFIEKSKEDISQD